MKSLAVQQLAPFLLTPAGQHTVLLDVREAWEVTTAALAVDGVRTLHIPMNDIPGRLADLDKTQPIVAFCHHGMRSAQVVAFLMHHGHTQVYNLAGGIEAWSALVDPDVARY